MKIRFANDYKTPGGRTYKAGSIHEIKSSAEARALIHRGKAVDAATLDDSLNRGQKGAPGAEKPRPGNASHEEVTPEETPEETPPTSAAAETTKTPPAKGKGKELSRG